MNNRKQYMFLHIEKTAGTSLVAYLKNVAGSSYFRKLTSKDRFKYIHPNELTDEFKKKTLPNLDIVAGHIKHDVVKKFMDDFYIITFLRDPISRVLSFYDYAKEVPRTADPITTKSKDLDIYDFLKFCQDSGDRRFANGTTFKLTDNYGVNELSNAKENLEKIDFIGIQEHFDESLAMLSYENNWKMVLKAPHTNKTKKRNKKDDIPSKVIDKIIEMNQDDIEIYKLGLKLYEKQRKKTILDIIEENQKLKGII